MKPSPSTDVCRMYEASADSYAEMMDQEINLPVYSDVLGRLEARIATKPGTLIDTACGSGHMLAMYHERYDPTRQLLGIDLSPRMVALAGERLGPSGEVLVGDMRDLSMVESDSAIGVLNYAGGGFLAGAAFSFFPGIAGRNQRLAELKPGRIGIGSAVTVGIVVPGQIWFLGDPQISAASGMIIASTIVVFAGGTALAQVKIAQRAVTPGDDVRDELEPASSTSCDELPSSLERTRYH